ncbi:unnamed protein product [Rhizophagus irregularis]|uniref:Secreted protein n=1 Tax=Rhizophagus irregularis TaxID=588596 RepID=A0A2I1G209_9GLOM|nr:hypothetical protein RhiirA4_454090 [Rhizophagus irregularis]CAB4430660.1 unnamed protein product [Rhizophagus irregularis]CAB4430737.1 unnamed protein product [Rhizophagus irregularis]
MRFARLCKLYLFFLVATATIAVGAPLDNVIKTPMVEGQATIETTFPQCPEGTTYVASLCFNVGRIQVFCQNPQNPTLEITAFTDCEADEVCIEHEHAINEDLNRPHATCVNSDIYTIWDNFNNPDADACAQEVYKHDKGALDLEIAMTIYAHDGKPIQVNLLKAFSNDNELSKIFDMHNYTQVIRGYNGETIKYCFNTGTQNKVTAYAGSWIIT